MSKFSIVLLLLQNIFFMKNVGVALAQDQCNSNSDCSFSKHCCRRRYTSEPNLCRRTCVGLTCNTNSDCGGIEEYCGTKKTCKKSVGDACYRHTDCISKYCCTQRFINDKNVCRDSCVGQTCHSNRDCGGSDAYCSTANICLMSLDECFSNFGCISSKYCCKRKLLSDRNVCRRNCIGETCTLNSDCGGPNESCNSKGICVRDSATDHQSTIAVWVILVIVGTLVSAVGVIIIMVWYCYRKKTRERFPTPQQSNAAVIALQQRPTQASAPLPDDNYRLSPTNGHGYQPPQSLQYNPPLQPQQHPSSRTPISGVSASDVAELALESFEFFSNLME